LGLWIEKEAEVQMQIEIFALCDAATADFGKLSMFGAFQLFVKERK